MKVVIMAGGQGRRIASLNEEVPKPMIPIEDKPILEYQIRCLKKQNLTEIILVIGYKGTIIEEYFGDGSAFGVNICYIREEVPLGTAGALFYLKDVLKEDFFLINGDIIFDINFDRFYAHHKLNDGLATIFTHPNSHPYDSGLIIADANGRVIKWMNKEEKRTWYKNCVNAGIHILSPLVLEYFTKPQKTDLDRDILKRLLQEGKLYSYHSPEYVKDMGTPDRYYEVVKDIRSGLVHDRNLRKKQKAFFLDRDGTINKYVGFLTDVEQMELIEGAAEAIAKMNKSGFLVIVVTNQPVIARGDVSFEGMEIIHNKLETLLGNEGAYVDDIFYCPHHPHKGYEGEISELKVECRCRKPAPGMLLYAAEKYNIDLNASWMIGDSESDIQAGMAAGCKVAYLGEREEREIPTYGNLLKCINSILG